MWSDDEKGSAAMWSADEKGSVTFVWAIENFKISWNQEIVSPVFLSNSLNNTEWKINLNPIVTDNIALGLTRCFSEDDDIERMVVDFKLSFLDNKGLPLRWKKIEKYGFRRGHNWTCQRFLERNVFFSREKDFSPDGTLTVSCRLRRSFNEDTETEIRFSRTRIEKICFFWTISDFCKLKAHQRKRLHVKKTDSETPFLTFDFVLEEKSEVEIDITSTECQRLGFLCFISLIDSFGKVFKSQGIWYFFELSESDRDPSTLVWGPKIWRFISFINKSFLCSNKKLYLPMDTLSMQVEVFFWTGDADSTNENIQQIPLRRFQITDETKTSTSLLSTLKVEKDSGKNEYTSDSFSNSRFMHDLQCMYEEGILSDFNLRVSSNNFPVHKSILSARSPVFRAMFTTEMIEKESDFIEIPDVDADTLQRMLLFVYLNRIEKDMEWENAMDLYFAADKYAIDELKLASCSILKKRLCASNACKILAYADLHGDQDLKSTTKDFIINNDSEVIGSEDWNKMLKNNIHLTVEIFSELYVKRMKK